MKLEHEMKIHMDYLEGKVELLSLKQRADQDTCDLLQDQLEIAKEKIGMLKEARSKEQKEAQRKIDELSLKQSGFLKRIVELENQLKREKKANFGGKNLSLPQEKRGGNAIHQLSERSFEQLQPSFAQT